MSDFISSIYRPILLLDEEIVRSNISALTSKARRHNLNLQPHFKTHQSLAIADWFRSEGVTGATVSSVTMATYFAEAGWAEVMIAFPINPRELHIVDQLASRARITVLIDSVESARFCLDTLQNSVSAFIEIDASYHRTGIWHEDISRVEEIIAILANSSSVNLEGLYGHAGDTYHCRGKDQIEGLHRRTINRVRELRKNLSVADDEVMLSIGDTPGCSVSEYFEDISIIRPGNFVFYDMTQCVIGSCSPDQVAVALACPIVFKDEGRSEITVYGGGVHLSKDSYTDHDGVEKFGSVVSFETRSGEWSEPLQDCYVRSVSQEHGVLKMSKASFDKFHIGDLIGILPAHSCMTADLMGQYYLLTGEELDHMSGLKYPEKGQK